MIRIAQLTDIHFMPNAHQPNHGMDTDRTLERVLDLVLPWKPDLIVCSGDLSENGDSNSYRRLGERLRRLPVPVYAIPGNHDDRQVFDRELPGGNVRHQSWVDLGNWGLILLDSSHPDGPHGQLDHVDLDQLESGLSRADGRPVLVFLHHPPVPIGSPWLDEMALLEPTPLFERLRGHTVRAIVAGHVHQEFEGERFGIPVYTTPSTCAQARPGENQFVFDDLGAGFRWLELGPNGQLSTGVQRIAEHYAEFMVG